MAAELLRAEGGLIPAAELAPAAGFVAHGYRGPLALLGEDERLKILAAHARGLPKPRPWWKALATASPLIHRFATQPSVLDPVCELLGDDVLLWGALIVERRPGDGHPWHCDVETSEPEARGVSVWIGLEHTVGASLAVIAGSHRLGVTVQQLAAEHGVGRVQLSDERVLSWARQRAADCHLVRPPLRDGDGLLMDGRLWHTGDAGDDAVRRALLLQYATPDTAIRIPRGRRYEWPFRFERTRPPCIAVTGSATGRLNHIVLAPSHGAEDPLAAALHPVRLPLPRDVPSGWTPHELFRGASPVLEHLSCHVSVLDPGCCPHPPHVHQDEELLVALDGEADIRVATAPDDDGRSEALRPGMFRYYPAQQRHTIRNAGPKPISYLMFRWHDEPRQRAAALASASFDAGAEAEPLGPGFATRDLLRGPTRYLDALHAHVTTLEPGAGYAPHADPYDVAIVMLRGEVETLGRTARAHDVVFYPAGSVHGARNAGGDVARYVVFEFHRADEGARRGSASASALRRAVSRTLRPFPRVRALLRAALDALA